MSLFDATIAHADVTEAVEATRVLLAASASIVDPFYLQSAADVYAHAEPDPGKTPWPQRFIVVRELQGFGGRLQSESALRNAEIQVMVAVKETRLSPRTYLETLHRRIYSVLTNQVLTLLNSGVHLPLWRERLSFTQYDADNHLYFGTAQYNTVLKPL